jgi:Tfp pilus assembly protein PilV
MASVPTNSCSRSSQSGLSLLEVLVATTIMSMTLVVLLQVLVGGLHARESGRRRIQAMSVAEKILLEHARPEVLAPGHYRGQDGPYSYVVQTESQYQLSLPINNSQIICYLIQVNVSWTERGRAKNLSTRTVRTLGRKNS